VDHRRQTPHEDADASKNNSSFERGDEWQHRTINNVGTFEYGKNKTRTRKQKPALSKPPNIRDVHRTKCIGITSDKQQKRGSRTRYDQRISRTTNSNFGVQRKRGERAKMQSKYSDDRPASQTKTQEGRSSVPTGPRAAGIARPQADDEIP